jgi:cell division septum initiation protein DivIVA
VTASAKAAKPPAEPALMPIGKIQQTILLVRGEKVILDADLAALYGVETKALNQAVKRNRERFPEDFMFQLTLAETKDLRSQHICLNDEKASTGSRSQTVTLNRNRNTRYAPHAFTEHGTIMAATVLNSSRAVQVSVYVVRAFMQLRQMLAQNKELAAKLAALERKVGDHDQKIVALIQAIRQLMAPPPEQPRRRIGFRVGP